MLIRDMFRRTCALTLAAAVLLSGGVFPLAGAAEGAVLSYQGDVVTVDTAAALQIKQSVSLDGYDLPQEAVTALNGYLIADVLRRDGVLFVTAYKAELGTGLGAPTYRFQVIAANRDETAKTISAVNGQTPMNITVYQEGAEPEVPVLSENNAALMETAPEAEKKPADEQEPENKPEDGDKTAEDGGKSEVDSSEPSNDEKQDPADDGDTSEDGGKPSADQAEDKGAAEENKQQNTTEQPNEEQAKTEQEPAAESQPEPAAAEPAEATNTLAAAFGFHSSVIGPRAVLSGSPDSGAAASGWRLLPDAVEGYSFTVNGETGKASVKLYGEGAEPSDPNAPTLDQPVDPQDVFGFRYDCEFDPNLSLGDLAGHTVSVDMSSFGNIFALGDLDGATGDSAVFSLNVGGTSLAVGTITVDKAKKTAAITFYDAAALQRNAGRDINAITGVSAWFWMSCRYTGDSGSGERPTQVELGGCEVRLDWSEIDAQKPACKITKKEAGFDTANRVITWEIKLTPEKGASLASAMLTDTLTDEEVTFESLQIGQQAAITGDALAEKISDKTLTHTFENNSETWPKNVGTTVTIKTKVGAQYFVNHYNQKSTITNTASIVNEAADIGFEKAETSADKTFDTNWMGKNGAYVSGAVSSSIKWTITLNPPVDLTNVKVYDLLDPSMVYDEKTANVTGVTSPEMRSVTNTDTNGFPTGLQADIAAIPDGQTRQLLIFTIPSLKAGAKTITFNTTVSAFAGIDGTLNAKIVNKAYMAYTISGGAGGDSDVSGTTPGVESPAVDYAQAAIQKTGSYDRSNRRITWTINANNNKQALTGGVKIEDDLTKLLTQQDGWRSSFVEDSVYWWVDGQNRTLMDRVDAAPVKYPKTPVYTLDNHKLTIYAEEMAETYHFSFQTEVIGVNVFKNSATAKRSNTASLTWDGKTVSHTADVTVISKYLVKEAVANNGTANGNGESYDPSDNTLWWKLQINADGREMTGADGQGGPTITDTLPEGTTYVGYELYAASVSKENYSTTNGFLHLVNAEKPLETGAVGEGSLLTVAEDGGKVSFRFNSKIAAAAGCEDWTTGRYILYVKTKVAPETLSGHKNNTVQLTNNASISGQDKGHDLTAKVSANKNISLDNLTKKGEQTFVDGKAVYEIKWTIDANLDGKANGLTDPTVTDTLPEGCTLKLQENGSYAVSITKLQKGKPSGEELAYTADGKANGWTYENGVFQFVLPKEAGDGEDVRYSAYRIVLTTEISAEFAGKEVKNSASMSATGQEIGSGGAAVQVRYFGAGAGGNYQEPPAGAKTLTVRKVSSAQKTLGVAGARFEVYYSTSDAADDFVRYGGATTRTDGTLTLRGLPATTKRVKLIEIKAPSGYLTPTNVETIVMMDGNTKEVTIENDPFGALTIIKRSSQTTTGADGTVQPGNLLAGAKFTLKQGETYIDLAGKPVAVGSTHEFTTDENGTIHWTGLPVGDYTLTETAAPSGYTLGAQSSWNITVAQLADGTMTVAADSKTADNAELTVLNDKESSHHGGGGGGGGGGGDKPKPVDPVNPVNPGGEIEIPDEETPLSPGVDPENPQNPTNTDGTPTDLVEIADEEAPKAAAEDAKTESKNAKKRLPQTGGLTAGLLIPLGALTMGAGALLQRRKKEDEE